MTKWILASVRWYEWASGNTDQRMIIYNQPTLRWSAGSQYTASTHYTDDVLKALRAYLVSELK